ncbi:MAG: Fe-S cluster assembly ATPase SufC [Spirochaetales bacterium]|jgi:Fe-S cluster assembly ATP-binding protein|nr:Fe-S cluster assembly ATPase SufC [Spirochaetales bacterium]
MTLEIKDLRASVEGKEILKGINLTLETGEIHALMGPNGSGKSTLANVMLGHPKYTVDGGSILLDGIEVLDVPTHERARKGLFLAFQYPVEVGGITIGKFLKRATEPLYQKNGKMDISAYLADLRENMAFLEIDQQFINRYLNDGFSGGEKKRMEILQMLMLKPHFSIMDETDSGLDIDALQIVSRGVNRLKNENFGALIITHYQRILNYIKPNKVHVLYQGKIVTSGGPELVEELEAKGYDWIKEDNHEYAISG